MTPLTIVPVMLSNGFIRPSVARPFVGNAPRHPRRDSAETIGLFYAEGDSECHAAANRARAGHSRGPGARGRGVRAGAFLSRASCAVLGSP